MRDNRPVMNALFESALAAGPASGELWKQLTADTVMLREHLKYLQEQGHACPATQVLIAAAMGAMLSMLAYALLPAAPDAPRAVDHRGYPDAQIVDARAPACCCTDWLAPRRSLPRRSRNQADRDL